MERRAYQTVLILTAAGPSFLPQIGENKKSVTSELFNEIDFDGSHPFKEVFVDDISNTFQSKNSVIFHWFIQNQAQGGPCSASLYGDANGRDFLMIPEHFFDGLSGLF
jgi:hypothetical protein